MMFRLIFCINQGYVKASLFSGSVRLLYAVLFVLLCTASASSAASRQESSAPPASQNSDLTEGRGTSQGIRAGINKGGPENWLPAQNLSSDTATAPNATAEVPLAPASSSLPPPGANGTAPRLTEQPQPGTPATLPTPAPEQKAATGKPPVPEAKATEQKPPIPEQKAAAQKPPVPEQKTATQKPPVPEQKAAAQKPPVPEQKTTGQQPPAAGQSSPAAGRGTAGAQVTGQTKLPQTPGLNATLPSANATLPVVYVDEKGNPVPKPPDIEDMLQQVQNFMQRREFQPALAVLAELKSLELSREQREKNLYYISDCMWELYQNKGIEGFESIISTTSEAMNSNLRSPKVPSAMVRLGQANLMVGNLREAEAYFTTRRISYPASPEVPASFLALGRALFDAGQYAKAVPILRDLVKNFSESPSLRQASVLLGSSLARLNEMQEAAIVLDFVEKRWPRYYLEDPSLLLLSAQLALQSGKLQEALQQYWHYYNLDPERKNNEKILLIIGEIYLRQGRLQAAQSTLEELAQRYPESIQADYAFLRLAEKGIHDGPALTQEEMFAVFANPGSPAPQSVYARLKEKLPDSPLGSLSFLKLVFWQLWAKQYVDAISQAADFIDQYPDEPGAGLARRAILQAFEQELQQNLREENYGRILILWNAFPLIRSSYSPLGDELRMALVRGHIERGEDKQAAKLLAPFLEGPKHPQYGDYTFTFFFNSYLAAGDWNAILDLGEKLAAWNFAPVMRNELDYAMALSAENLGLPGRALPLWQSLAQRNEIPLYERAYANYFLARDAERRKDIKAAYNFNKNTLELFLQLQDERSDKADPERVKEAMNALMDITEVSNRIPEALEWLERYNDFVPEGVPEYPGLRFREARLYRKLGNMAKSRALLEQIVRLDPESAFGKAASAELRTFDVSRDLDRFAPR